MSVEIVHYQQKAQTQVFIKVNPAPQGDDPQPVHIHFGSCGANLGAVDVSLNDIVAGESVTLANASLSSLRSGSRVINVHRSYDEISIYTACGGIPKQLSSPPLSASSIGAPIHVPFPKRLSDDA